MQEAAFLRSPWLGTAEVWAMRKEQSRSRRTDRNGRLVGLNGKQEITAWPASKARSIAVTPALTSAYFAIRNLEVQRRLRRQPDDWTEKRWDTDVISGRWPVVNTAYWMRSARQSGEKKREDLSCCNTVEGYLLRCMANTTVWYQGKDF
jgi:hypothetical protein